MVRSVSTSTSILAGSAALSCGSSAWIRSTTSMTLAPGWRWMLRMIAWSVFIQAASLVFSAPSMARATSDSFTGRAVAVGHHQVVVVGGLPDLIIGVDRVGLARPVEIALRAY
mgnify:CR=1 FL=1